MARKKTNIDFEQRIDFDMAKKISRPPSPRAAIAMLKDMIECGLSVALDEYMGGYQCTVYPFGKNDPTKHLHYEAKTIEEAIVLAHNDTYGK